MRGNKTELPTLTKTNKIYWLGGVLFTVAIAFTGYGLSKLPWLGLFGPMLLAIILAAFYRHWFDYPQKFSAGINFVTKFLLRVAIVLYGFRLNIHTVLGEGVSLLVFGGAVIVFVLLISRLVARLLRADSVLSFLLAVGTGVCGAAAIATVSSLIKANDEDTATSVGLIALTGTIFAMIGTLIYNMAAIDPVDFAIWAGLSLHEIAHVVAAAAQTGDDGSAIAILAKLGRVLLLIPLCFGIVLYFKYRLKRKRNEENEIETSHDIKEHIPFPWYLIGFVFASIIATYVSIPDFVLRNITMLSTFLLTCAMAGLGLNISTRTIYSKAWRPFLMLLIVSTILCGVMYFFIVI